jgi:hypothetical protein
VYESFLLTDDHIHRVTLSYSFSMDNPDVISTYLQIKPYYRQFGCLISEPLDSIWAREQRRTGEAFEKVMPLMPLEDLRARGFLTGMFCLEPQPE